jgi:hypothetical protein
MPTHTLTAGEQIDLGAEVRLTVLAVTEDEVVLGLSRPLGVDEPDLPGWEPPVQATLTALPGRN